REDRRLSNDVFPLNYAIDLEVNVRGHAGAKRSEFNGTVTIYLDIRKPTAIMELHSKELIIDNAKLRESEIFSKPIDVSRISFNPERETISIHMNRTLLPGEMFMLISHTADSLKWMHTDYMRIGWLQIVNWKKTILSRDSKLNASLDSNGPFILASNNFPTGARLWFPCFDESDKKVATFEVQINHPSGLNAYANTDVERIDSIGPGRKLSVFEKTQSLATYQVALSINHLAIQPIEVGGYGKIRLISSKNSHEYTSSQDIGDNRNER
ncbi:hypothetical protein PMAYCL1PPCAC_07917, partial [Pristionchus mayeri]